VTKTSDQATAQEDPKFAELLKKLAAAEERAQQLEIENDALTTDASSGLKVRKEPGGPFTGPEGGYKFSIGPLNAELFPHLPKLEQYACDESELKRWYAATHENPPKSGKRLDLLKVKLEIVLLDPRRAKLIIHKQKLANIRSKLEAGASLTSAEQATMDKYEREILGTASDEE